MPAWIEIWPIVASLISWEGIKFVINLRLSKRKEKQEVDHNEFNYVRQIASQSSESLIEMNEKLLGIIKESTNKSTQIDDLSVSINRLNANNNKLQSQLDTEKRSLTKLKEFSIELISCVEQYCKCESSQKLTRLKNEIRL